MTMTRRAIGWLNPAGWLVIAALIAALQVLVDSGVLDYEYLPSPSEVASGFGDIVSAGGLGQAIGETLGAALAAAAIAIVIGVALGVTIGLVPAVRTWTLASIDVLRTIPVVALMPVALLVWGPSLTTEIAVATYAALWPILINSASGASAVHPRLTDVARMLELSRARSVRSIVVPAAMPAILVGARLAIVTALVIAIVAEMLVDPRGLGWALVQAQQGLQPAQMWAYVVLIGLLGLALNALLVRVARLALPGSQGLAGHGGAR
jgi:ABC-type nitrate/sulfonate/bicarbonate transport system permease component